IMRLLVTRPRDDAEAFAKILRARGHDAIVAPLMEMRVVAGPPVALEGVQGVLATSANGVRALATGTTRCDVTIYAVGPQTAEAARKDALDGVFLFSPRSAKIFAMLVGDAGLAAQCARLVAFCISVATAEALSPLSFARVAVAGAPNQDAILDLVSPP